MSVLETERAGSKEAGERPLERRRRPGERAGGGGLQIAVSPAGFKQALIKYVRRQNRTSRAFCLAALDVLEFAKVAQSRGTEAADLLAAFAERACLAGLRDCDRLTAVGHGRFIVLLPDCDRAGAEKALERLAAGLAATPIQFHHEKLRASLSYRIADSAKSGADPEALLAEIDCGMDALGRIQPSRLLPAVSSQPFSGEFAAWVSRYENLDVKSSASVGNCLTEQRADAYDSWRQAPVTIRIIELADGAPGFEAGELATIARRARVLAAIAHPSVLPLTDYCVRDGRALYIVQEAADLQPLIGPEAPPCRTAAAVLSLCHQLLNLLIYLQGLVPPVVPPPFDQCVPSTDRQGQLILTGFEVPYLLPWCHQPGELSAVEWEAAAQGRHVAAYTPVLRSVGRLILILAESAGDRPQGLVELARAVEDGPPARMDTAFKLRAALKELEALASPPPHAGED